MHVDHENEPALQGYPIKVAVRRTGLTSHAIRVWEKRYSAVTPVRTPTNRRLYSEADIERLQLLRRATLAGHSIGQIAGLPIDDLRALVAREEALPARPPARGASPADAIAPDGYLDTAVHAVEALDARALQETLTRASVSLSQPMLMEGVIVPLMHRIGDLWQEGELRVAHEHLASSVVRTFIGNLESAHEATGAGPGLIVATPAGHLHEFGALMAATAAASDGWRVSYLGPNLPAEEIAGAAQQGGARAVALSIVYLGDAALDGELRRLGRCLPKGVDLLIGGRASEAYSETIGDIGGIWVRDIPDLRARLESMRLRDATET